LVIYTGLHPYVFLVVRCAASLCDEGIFLLLFRKASNKTILICAILFMFVIPFGFSVVMRNQPDTFTDADYRNAYEHSLTFQNQLDRLL